MWDIVQEDPYIPTKRNSKVVQEAKPICDALQVAYDGTN